MKKIIFALFITNFIFSQSQTDSINYPKSLADYNDFKKLVLEVEPHRKEKLISLNKFIEMSKEKNVIILDTRSFYFYSSKHLKGAININFSDFTQPELNQKIPNKNTKILIYCNNNFNGDDRYMYSKTVEEEDINLIKTKPLTLALNIPTYINLYGYGYKNVYELNELVDIRDERIEFEGSAVEN